jgi:hypothetical protein
MVIIFKDIRLSSIWSISNEIWLFPVKTSKDSNISIRLKEKWTINYTVTLKFGLKCDWKFANFLHAKYLRIFNFWCQHNECFLPWASWFVIILVKLKPTNQITATIKANWNIFFILN